MTLDLINRFAKVKFNAGTKNHFRPLREFVQHTAFDINGVEAYDADEDVDLHAALGSVN
jgi:hypothetical protein